MRYLLIILLFPLLSFAGDSIAFVTHSEFSQLIDNEALEIDLNYLITDYQTIHYIHHSSLTGNDLVRSGDIEPIIVKSIAGDLYHNRVKSAIHKTDIIEWQHDNSNLENDYPSHCKGVITKRERPHKQIEMSFDFEGWKFRRYKGSDGKYNVARMQDAINPTNFQDYSIFGSSNTSSKVGIIGRGNAYGGTNHPSDKYKVPNIVFKEGANMVYIKSATDCTIESTCYDVDIDILQICNFEQLFFAFGGTMGGVNGGIVSNISFRDIQFINVKDFRYIDASSLYFLEVTENVIKHRFEDAMFGLAQNSYKTINPSDRMQNYNAVSSSKINPLTGDFHEIEILNNAFVLGTKINE